jgi:hypothetical protein
MHGVWAATQQANYQTNEQTRGNDRAVDGHQDEPDSSNYRR